MNHCLLCGKEIPSKNKFCSQSHSAIYNNSHRPKKKYVCQFCGKEFSGYTKKNNKYCSIECANKAKFDKYNKLFLKGEINQQHTLKRHFIELNDYKCSICGLKEWQNKPIVLILDHINGNPYDNSPKNLRLVCPNCDSQLPTYKSKNKGHGRYYRRKRYKEGKSS